MNTSHIKNSYFPRNSFKFVKWSVERFVSVTVTLDRLPYSLLVYLLLPAMFAPKGGVPGSVYCQAKLPLTDTL